MQNTEQALGSQKLLTMGLDEYQNDLSVARRQGERHGSSTLATIIQRLMDGEDVELGHDIQDDVVNFIKQIQSRMSSTSKVSKLAKPVESEVVTDGQS